jgi:large subunit ribosomal protein L1
VEAMDTTKVLEALKKLRESVKKRNFKQSIDFAIILKEVDLNSAEGKIDEYIALPVGSHKKAKICAFVDKDLSTEARKVFDKVIAKDEFSQWAGNKKGIKALAREFDYFVAQATIMTDVAAIFGKVLGPKGKMPNPKAGCVVLPKSDLHAVKHKLESTIRLRTNKQPVISAMIGNEESKDEDLAKNIIHVFEFIKKKLPRGDQQIKKTYVKMTMSEPVYIGA